MKRIGLSDLLGLAGRLVSAAEAAKAEGAAPEEEKTLRKKLASLAAREPGALTRAVLEFTPFEDTDGVALLPVVLPGKGETEETEKPSPEETEKPDRPSAPGQAENPEKAPARQEAERPREEPETVPAAPWQPPRDIEEEAAHVRFGRETGRQGLAAVRAAEQGRDLLRQLELLLEEEMAYCGEEVYRT